MEWMICAVNVTQRSVRALPTTCAQWTRTNTMDCASNVLLDVPVAQMPTLVYLPVILDSLLTQVNAPVAPVSMAQKTPPQTL